MCPGNRGNPARRFSRSQVTTDQMMDSKPFTLPFRGISPAIGTPAAFFDRACAVLGRARIGRAAAFAPFAVVRADGHVINAGDDLFLGAHATVHIAHDLYGSTIGDRVTVGRNSIVHACTIGDDCVLEDDVAVLDGAAVGSGCVLAAGSVVYPRAMLPPGHWCEGSPAQPVRTLTAAERDELRERVRASARSCDTTSAQEFRIEAGAGSYVAATAVGRAHLVLGPQASIWFGCVLDADGHPIRIGAGTNVQDNSVLRTSTRTIEIGERTTIGHNVLLEDCTIGSGSLIGMGSRLAPGTTVQDDVFVAAGTHTSEGQLLTSGSLWGGRPARPIAALRDSLRSVVAETCTMYCGYAQKYAARQADLAG